MARKRNTIGCLFYVALVLLVLVIFLFNRARVQQVIEKTGFARLFERKRGSPAEVVVAPPGEPASRRRGPARAISGAGRAGGYGGARRTAAPAAAGQQPACHRAEAFRGSGRGAEQAGATGGDSPPVRRSQPSSQDQAASPPAPGRRGSSSSP